MIPRPMLSSLLAAGLALSTACQATHPTAATLPASTSELLDQHCQYEVVRYLYRWHLDEEQLEKAVDTPNFVFWIKPLHPKLDPDDHSIFAEMIFPTLDLVVRLKKSDYTIPELGITIRNDHFKITEVDREVLPDHAPVDCTVITIPTQRLRDDLFATRNDHAFPTPELIERMRAAVREEAQNDPTLQNIAPGDKTVYLAPLSPISNECWVFWEAEHKLFYFSSDIDIVNPAVWQNEKLDVQIFDLDDQVVVAPDEAPGSSRFLTRNEVGRALFNCIILGQRIVLPPPTTQ